MQQSYKVFINNKSILISNIKKDEVGNDELSYLNYELVKNNDEPIKSFINSDLRELQIFAEDPTMAIKELFFDYKPIAAAGGLVKNEKGEFLFIFRNGKWDLPKGKIELGESIDEGALREVKEECGLKTVNLVNKLPSTLHIYEQKGTSYIKTTHWFLMESKNDQILKPQIEEGITEVKWISPNNFDTIIKNTFSLIRELILPFEKV